MAFLFLLPRPFYLLWSRWCNWFQVQKCPCSHFTALPLSDCVCVHVRVRVTLCITPLVSVCIIESTHTVGVTKMFVCCSWDRQASPLIWLDSHYSESTRLTGKLSSLKALGCKKRRKDENIASKPQIPSGDKEVKECERERVWWTRLVCELETCLVFRFKMRNHAPGDNWHFIDPPSRS